MILKSVTEILIQLLLLITELKYSTQRQNFIQLLSSFLCAYVDAAAGDHCVVGECSHAAYVTSAVHQCRRRLFCRCATVVLVFIKVSNVDADQWRPAANSQQEDADHINQPSTCK